MNRRSHLAFGVLAFSVGLSARAQIAATATFTPQSLPGGHFRYSAVLHNTGTTTVGTMWFAWRPGYDFMHSMPTNITSPPGWYGYSVNNGVGDGYSIEWYSYPPGSEAPAGTNLSGFGFDSADAPVELRGPSETFPAPVATTYVYIGLPEYDPGYAFLSTIGNICYANCDNSTTAPVLNVLDFSCFLNKFAAGDTYANCDNSTTPPVLNVLDFSCFLNQFAAGCP